MSALLGQRSSHWPSYFFWIELPQNLFSGSTLAIECPRSQSFMLVTLLLTRGDWACRGETRMAPKWPWKSWQIGRGKESGSFWRRWSTWVKCSIRTWSSCAASAWRGSTDSWFTSTWRRRAFVKPYLVCSRFHLIQFQDECFRDGEAVI